MLELTGMAANVGTVFALAATTPTGSARPASAEALRNGYLDYLDHAQGQALRPCGPGVDIVVGGDRLAGLIGQFNLESVVDDRRYVLSDVAADAAWRADQGAKAAASVKRLTERLPTFGALFNLVMTCIFAARATQIFGGTTSNALGVLWICPDPEWAAGDFDEFLVHELAHTLVFLDERRFGHFTDRERLPHQDTWTRSAIRGGRRPLDKSLHSIIVATEVVLCRRQLPRLHAPRLHPQDDQLRDGALSAIEDIASTPAAQALLTPRAQELIALCHQRLTALPPRFDGN